MRYIVILLLLAIIASLISAFIAMMKSGRGNVAKERSEAMFRAFAWRIGLSFVLFILLIVGYLLGWIQPLGYYR